MVAKSIFIDNCVDGSRNQIELITDPFFDKSGPFFDAYGEQIPYQSKESQLKSLTYMCGLSSDYEGRTTLHSYAKLHSTENLRQLLKSINDLEEINCADDYGNTPLHFAATLGVSESVLLLLNAGADANIKNSYGETALDLAISNEDLVSTDALISLKKVTTK